MAHVYSSTGEMSISEKLAEQKAVLQEGEHRAISMELLPEDAQNRMNRYQKHVPVQMH